MRSNCRLTIIADGSTRCFTLHWLYTILPSEYDCNLPFWSSNHHKFGKCHFQASCFLQCASISAGQTLSQTASDGLCRQDRISSPTMLSAPSTLPPSTSGLTIGDALTLDFGKTWMTTHINQSDIVLKKPLIVEEFGKAFGGEHAFSALKRCQFPLLSYFDKIKKALVTGNLH